MMNLPRPPSQNKLSRKLKAPIFLQFISCLLCVLTSHIASAGPAREGKAAELESIRSQIKDMQSELNAARDESEKLQEELRENEIAASRQALKLKGLEEQIALKHERLYELNGTIRQYEQLLATEQQQLARQIRSAYMIGRSDYLKLLLNQEDPALVGRVLAYHDYVNRAKTRSIQSITDKVSIIHELREALQADTDVLEELKTRQLAQSEKFREYRESRQVILARLQDTITGHGLQLKTLQDNEHRLSLLMDSLARREDSILFLQDTPPFESLKGKLEWPVNGKLLNSFGGTRRGAALKWQGVKISTRAGGEVRAVHTGKVIFADWFRNLGLLMILDHGEEYMSLYGHNQNLLKKPGDWVLAGETIALAGDTGGQDTPGVYFEIRHRGKPLNPALWCLR
jgi:murein hydrolase activator